MIIELDGNTINSEKDFHKKISSIFSVTEFYGCNLNSLWDLLSTDIERPVKILWKNANNSKNKMGESFDKIINIFERVRIQDESFGWTEKFTYELE